jgi:multidrug efflux pump
VFHEFAVTLSIAILFSMVISLTITPCMCAYLLSPGGKGPTPRPAGRMGGAAVRSVQGRLCALAGVVLNHTLLVGLVLIGLIVGNVFLFRLLPRPSSPSRTTAS